MAENFKAGDKVGWSTPQGKTHGKVVRKLTSDCHVEGTKISASEDDPRYLVESEKTGKPGRPQARGTGPRLAFHQAGHGPLDLLPVGELVRSGFAVGPLDCTANRLAGIELIEHARVDV